MDYCFTCVDSGIIYESDPYGDCVNLEPCDCEASKEKLEGNDENN